MSKRTPILRPVLLVLLLALGGGIVIGNIVIWCATTIDRLVNPPTQNPSLSIEPDGTPVIVRYLGRLGGKREYRTLDGEVLSGGHYRESLQGATLRGPDTQARYERRSDWHERIIPFTDYASPPTYWYFVHDGKREGRGYFVAFDSVSKLRLGYLARGGFSAGLPPREDWFPVAGWQMRSLAAFEGGVGYLQYATSASIFGQVTVPIGLEALAGRIAFISGNQLLEVDFRARTTRVLFESSEIFSEARSVRGRPLAQTKAREEEASYHLAVRLADRVRVLDRKSGEHRDYLLPPEARNPDFDFYELYSGTALVKMPPWGPSYRLFRINAEGKVLKRWDISLGEPPRPGPRVREWAIAVFLPCPAIEILPVFIVRVGMPWDQAFAAHLPYWQRLAAIFTQYWPWFALVALLAAVFAWLTYRRQRRFALGWTWVWVPLVFLLGLPGFLGYLCHRRWPVREACPACGRVVPRDRAACCRCGIDFPAPAPKGIEVFA